MINSIRNANDQYYETDSDAPWREESGREESGREEKGREESGREESGREESGGREWGFRGMNREEENSILTGIKRPIIALFP